MARRRAIQDKELVPRRRADLGIRRRRDGARLAGTGEGRKDGALSHVVTVGRADGRDERHLDGAGERRGQRERHRLPVGPVFVCNSEGRLGRPGQNVVGREVLEPVLLRVDLVLRVGA